MFKNMWANPRTSIAGIFTVLAVAVGLFHWVDPTIVSTAASLLAGLGLISAADQATINNAGK